MAPSGGLRTDRLLNLTSDGFEIVGFELGPVGKPLDVRAFSPADDRTYGRAWLFAIMRNIVLEWQRTAARRIKLVLVPDAELTELAPADLSAPLAELPALLRGAPPAEPAEGRSA